MVSDGQSWCLARGGLALAVRSTIMFVVMPYVARSGAALKAAAAAYRKAKRVGGIGSRMRLLV